VNARRLLAALASALLAGAAARAQEPPVLTREFGDAAREHLAEPGVLERVNEHRAAGRLARLLEDLNIQFKTFERDSDGELALGFSYDFAKSLLASDEASARAVELVASGNVAFDQESNPDDFLVTAVRMRSFGSHAFGGGDSRAARAETLPDPGPDALAAFDPQRFAELATRFAEMPSSADVRADPDFQALARSYFESIERELPPELIWDFDLHAAYESNQDFSSRQVAFGSSLGGRFVSWDPGAGASRWNVFDYPTAALRWLAGQDEDFRASGEAYPTLVAGLDLVDATGDDARSAVTDDVSYLRARLEAGLKSRVLDLEEESLFLSAGWRYYGEIDAPAAVRRVDQDYSSHLQLQLDLPKGWALTYSTGRLPLDTENDSTFALGFQVHF
jgi:hypothetical protein